MRNQGTFSSINTIGRGYDDGLITAISVLDMIDRSEGQTLAELHASLPQTWNSPTMSPYCSDEKKYEIVDQLTSRIEDMQAQKLEFGGNLITELNNINGIMG